MMFRLLGPVHVEVRGRRVQVATARQRAVLAVLLLEANRSVSIDQIVERVWGGQRLPARPQNTVRTYMSLLRRLLRGIEGVAIERQPRGYLIDIDEEAVDVHRFRKLLKRARASDDAQAAALIEEATSGLWRGEPFADLDTPWLNAARDALLMERQAAKLDLSDIQLRWGQHTSALADLAVEAEARPLDERVAAQFMLAFYRNGQPAEAFAQYRRIRERLSKELGTDPGPRLQLLHQQILTADRGLDLHQAPDIRPVALSERSSVVPRQLPATPGLFVGRARELAELTASGRERRAGGREHAREHADERTMAVSVISGKAGAGKTWLALRWAHQHADCFPDGQLYLNLRGSDPDGQQPSPQAAVRGFLDALGVGPAALPLDPDAQAGLYRTLAAGKRLLIVLDDAGDSRQVAPLLPGSPTCTVLVTSRRQLGGLTAAYGAGAVELGMLTEPEARQLLVRRLDRERIAAEPEAVADVLAACAGLPSALAIVAARAARHPELPLSAFAARLRKAADRPGAQDPQDDSVPPCAAVTGSGLLLSGDLDSFFGPLGPAPGPEVCPV